MTRVVLTELDCLSCN